ncbi:MAG TPA: adenosylcobalamin-dependent ribonucleoside-diphosphate reductase [Kofleriaceae bacterium]|nr:adenosylcobalamin-dependent ribonucleoside-diphosphate reductase [Kofleriaceae bacterium]
MSRQADFRPADAPAGLSESAWAVLRRRYLRKDEDGEVVETPDQLFRRVARVVAAPDAAHGASAAGVVDSEERFYRRMASLEFLPNSPTLMNAGRPRGQLAACFVVPVGDAMPDIFDAIKWAAEIQMTGGGTGFSFSRLRPSGDRVASTGGTASGPLAFLDVFNAATDAVKQGGARRGANMGVLRVDHPDILEFVSAKLDPARLTNFNISVAVTDAFMEAAARGGSFELVNPRTGRAERRLDARRLLGTIAAVAWRTGDPGVLFIDRINDGNPIPDAGAIEATNPCGEQPLLPFESCVLGSVNLARFASAGRIDWPALGLAVRDGVHFLDNVIDANSYPLPQIEAVTRAHRKIGLGVMGFADLLVEIGVAYDSGEALAVAAELAGFVERESLEASAELAVRRGPFARFATSRWAAAGHPPLRNATTTTVAPTGTISILAGCSSGIEPLYALSLVRRVLEGERLVEVHPRFRQIADQRGFWSDELAAALAAHGAARGLVVPAPGRPIPADVQALFATAHDVPPETHVRMQAAFQRHSHSAVSKTVNLPGSATADDVERIYRLAHELGCKGVTVYRDGSRSAQVLSFGELAQDAADPAGRRCPECGTLVRGDGMCAVCPDCGWALCAAI